MRSALDVKGLDGGGDLGLDGSLRNGGKDSVAFNILRDGAELRVFCLYGDDGLFRLCNLLAAIGGEGEQEEGNCGQWSGRTEVEVGGRQG